MNAVSAQEDGAGLENLPPNGAPEGRVTGMGRHPAAVAGCHSTGGDACSVIWLHTHTYWVMQAELLSGGKPS